MSAKSTKRKKSTKRRPNKAKENTALKEEIWILLSLAVCILMVISNFGIGGMVGEAASSVMFGLFGYMAYVLPFVLFAGIAFGVLNKGNTRAYIKITAGVLLFILITVFLELVINKYQAGTALLDYYHQAGLHKNAGGLVGGAVLNLLCPLIGVAGTYVVTIVLAVICVILITEKSLLAPLGSHGKKAYEGAKRKHEQTQILRQEKRQARNETKQEKRSDRKVSGVSFATTLTEQLPSEMAEEKTAKGKGRKKRKSPELKELSADTAGEEIGEIAEEPKNNAAFMDAFVITRAEQPEAPEEAVSDNTAGGGTYEELDELPKKPRQKKIQQSPEEAAEQVQNVARAIQTQEAEHAKKYEIPPLSLLKKGKKGNGDSDAHLRATAMKLEQTFQNFGVRVHVTNASCGPSVTRYELQPEQGVKVSKIVGLADDIKLNLAVADLRIEAPIPGKAAVGIEVPNNENTAVMLRDLLESDEFKTSKSGLSFAVGKDIAGKVVVADIAKMPHLLVAGATGSGKSVCINTLIMSIIYKSSPEDVKLIMVDPKVVELSVYNGIPHLLIPVVTDPKKAAGALNWAVAEMMKRYQLFAEYNVRDLKGFNEKVGQMKEEESPKPMPQIVIIVDELADLMMVAPGEVESAICRLAQLARAAGLHLILATQRPSVNVITGLIKANMPSRIAFSVSSGVDSRTIIDMNGAEKLLGKGDMLFYPVGYPKPVRVQGSFVSDKEVQKVVDHLIEQNGNACYSDEIEEHVSLNAAGTGDGLPGTGQDNENDRDAYFTEAGRLIVDKEKASIGMLQRMFKIGFNRAARIMDQLCEAGVVGPEEGTKPRKVLMSKEEFEQFIEENI
ncbi:MULTISPECIES: FtsK/SpoIIIE family DNA translocase [Mediterraneibacter]|uniref:FtsK/SpoIIIE family DNA translocase n=1 Tax=Mediterraneibacter TaxID=2316020 RepID=UPI000E46A626|nr:DNA translocase FtsK [Mediterraneibacter massiliensis]RGT74559.1 DNA translocase FtsK [Ruminococcus sp. AF18-22]